MEEANLEKQEQNLLLREQEFDRKTKNARDMRREMAELKRKVATWG